jgi:hypothetical protein
MHSRDRRGGARKAMVTLHVTMGRAAAEVDARS